MIFATTPIQGVVEVTIESARDERGSFGRIFCRQAFASNGLSSTLEQCSVSTSARRGTVRGFHLQAAPHAEAKLVQCIRGRLFDVTLDLRPGSPTYGAHHAVELLADQPCVLYIPEGCAHAFQTLADDTRVLYYISAAYDPDSVRGVRWDDPELGIAWPIRRDIVISRRDRDLPTLAEFAESA